MENERSEITTDQRTILIGKRIKELRLEKKFSSAKKFARYHRLPYISYELQERGKRNMTLGSLYKILDIHNISLADFFKNINLIFSWTMIVLY